jgi:hypothetical protein
LAVSTSGQGIGIARVTSSFPTGDLLATLLSPYMCNREEIPPLFGNGTGTGRKLQSEERKGEQRREERRVKERR